LKYQEKNINIEEKLGNLQIELEDTKMQLNRAQQKEKASEDYNSRLSQTIDKLLNESNERLQMHVKERMQSIDEKNQLQQECDKVRKLIEELESDKSRMHVDIERLKADIDYWSSSAVKTQKFM
jgi:predicted  nucleic acid-binding Zn-ribbon protein